MEKGYSLVDLLTVLAITASTLMIAVPSTKALINKERAISDASLLHGSLQQARLYAVTTGQPTTIQAIDNDWKNGWRTFSDPNQNINADQSIRLIAEQGPRSSRIIATSTLQNGVHFLPNGRAILQNGGFQAGTLNVCESDSTRSHDLIINRVGRVRRASEAHNPKCASPAP